MADGWTIDQAVAELVPAIPRRDLVRALVGVAPIGTIYGRRGRRPRTYPVAAIMQAHAAWVDGKVTRPQGADG